jgi:hypothetical protein
MPNYFLLFARRLIGTAGPVLFQSRPFYIQDTIDMPCSLIVNIKSISITMIITRFFVIFSSCQTLYEAIGVVTGFRRAHKTRPC